MTRVAFSPGCIVVGTFVERDLLSIFFDTHCPSSVSNSPTLPSHKSFVDPCTLSMSDVLACVLYGDGVHAALPACSLGHTARLVLACWRNGVPTPWHLRSSQKIPPGMVRDSNPCLPQTRFMKCWQSCASSAWQTSTFKKAGASSSGSTWA